MTLFAARLRHLALLGSLLGLSLTLNLAHAETQRPSPETRISAWCADLGKRLRSVNADHCRQQGFLADQSSHGDRPLAYLDRAAAKAGSKSPRPNRVLIIGGIHGDELTSISIVFRWLDWIDEGSAKNYHWHVIPLANPDGLFNRPSTRTNGRGVDLNRNFPTPDWSANAQTYWVERTRRDPRRNPGQEASSEVETRWLQAQISHFKPDVIISIHAPYNLLDYDGPATQPLRFGRLSLNRLGVYPGSLGNYGGLHKKIPVVTIELPSAGTMPSARDQRAMWVDMLKWMGRNIKPLEK
ncbi:MAG: M14 family zinc carboxypeptidase [Dechloromonas sp.]|nr:M14 family zinc carboxypeptidase [Dechloromonas sp.]